MGAAEPQPPTASQTSGHRPPPPLLADAAAAALLPQATGPQPTGPQALRNDAAAQGGLQGERQGWLPGALNGGWIYRDRVETGDAGRPVSRFYAERHHHSDRDVWRQRLEAGEIRLNGRTLADDAPLQAGDRLAWHRPPWREDPVPAHWGVVFDDGDLLVLDKPAGLPVLPGGGWLEHTLLRLLERRHRGDPAGVPKPVHRLGRFTTGLLVCARRPESRAWLSRRLRESTARGAAATAAVAALEGGTNGGPSGAVPADSDGSCRKVYRALLRPGVLDLEPGASLTIRTPIGRRPHPRLGTIWCAADGAQASDLPACSRVTLLQRSGSADLVAVAIASGRPHQIRIHCAAAGAPLLGDPLYRAGGLAVAEALPGEGGYRLQAWRLEMERPEGGRLALEAPRPLMLPGAG